MKVIIRRVEETIVEVADVAEMRELRDGFSTGKIEVQKYCMDFGLEGSLKYTVKQYKG